MFFIRCYNLLKAKLCLRDYHKNTKMRKLKMSKVCLYFPPRARVPERNIGYVGVLLLLIITFCVYTRYALTKFQIIIKCLYAYLVYTLLGAVKIMETKEIVELMLKSSDHNPYTGMLSKKDNLIAAIDLAKLCKDFADKGQTDEAMNIPSKKWLVVISELEGMSLNCA